MRDADAADLTQEVFALARAANRLEYDPNRGSFRAWLFTVVRNKLYDYRVRRRRHPPASGNSDVQELLEEHSAPDEVQFWEEEYQQRLFHYAADQIKDCFEPSTWQAFWRTALEGKSGKETAHELGLSIAAVYLAKSRVTARLKREIRRLQQEEG